MSHGAVFQLVPQTAIFNAGACRDQRELIRIPSLKGLLLWWFRAALGAACPLDQLRRLATGYYGSQRQAGDLRMHLSGLLPKGRYPLRPYDKHETRWSTLDGFRYLAYGLEGRPFYDPADRPPLRLSIQCTRQETWEVTWCSLWLLSRLGGLGARTRRGMGGFVLQAEAGVRPPAGLPALGPQTSATADKVAAELCQGLNKVATCLGRHAGVAPPRFAVRAAATTSAWGPTGPQPKFSCFAPGCWRARIIRLDSTDWEAGLDALGRMYQSWRHPPVPGRARPLSKDFGVASDYVRLGKASGSRLAAFGLPLLFSFHSGKHAGARVGVRKAGRPRVEDSRRASPVFLRLLPFSDSGGKIFAAVHVFKSEFLGDPIDTLEFYMKEAARVAGKIQAPSAPFPVNWTEVDSFINSLNGPELYVC